MLLIGLHLKEINTFDDRWTLKSERNVLYSTQVWNKDENWTNANALLFSFYSAGIFNLVTASFNGI